MTHKSEQRWVATPSRVVTQIILDNQVSNIMSRFYRKIDYGFELNDCHIWTGALSDEGYGDFWFATPHADPDWQIGPRGRTVRAHRIAYMWKFGPPDEKTPFLDHLNCVGRFCVNPDHLEPVNNQENTKRGRGIGAGNQRVVRSQELLKRKERRDHGEQEIFY